MKESSIPDLEPQFHEKTLCDFLVRMSGNDSETVRNMMMRLVKSYGEGNVCLRLSVRNGNDSGESKIGNQLALSTEEYDVLCALPIVSTDGSTPLVIEEDRLYFQRFYSYERSIFETIETIAQREWSDATSRHSELLDALFPGEKKSDDQKRAASVSLQKKLTIITGGPGTGKTTTVVKLLALHLSVHPQLRILLSAPTGKAARRLQEAIVSAKGTLAQTELFAQSLIDRIPERVSTLHSLLGSDPVTNEFRYNRENPLAVDLFVIDEASMVDLVMFHRMLSALPEKAGLLVIGDHFQLASVDAGAVLGDLCNRGSETYRSRIDANIVELKHSHRFSESSGIGKLTQMIRDGSAPPSERNRFFSLFDKKRDIRWIRGEQKERELEVLIRDRYEKLFKITDPSEALSELNRFRILTPFRHGPAGVIDLNRRIGMLLRSAHYPFQQRGRYFNHQPILITRNDYGYRLYNGDTGIILSNPGGELRAYFYDYDGGDGALREFHPEFLPPFETCFAMTVHKSQGSEFDDVAMILPDRTSPLLTAELLYTAVSRAKKRFDLFAEESAFFGAVSETVRRTSGISARLLVPYGQLNLEFNDR